MAKAWLNGEWLDKDDLKISPSDFGFARGMTLFEYGRVYSGLPFRLEDHLARLKAGAADLQIEPPYSYTEIEAIIRRMCAENAYEDSAFSLYMTAGDCEEKPLNLGAASGFKPHLMIFEDPVPCEHPEAPKGLALYQKGQKVLPVPCERALPEIKTTNYTQGIMAARKAGAEWDDILYTHHDGYITEALRSNLFCVIDGALCTPARGMLKGITRQVILELAHQEGIPVQERDLLPEDLNRATEAYTTASSIEIFPIRQIGDVVLPGGEDRMQTPVFRKLRKAYTKATGR